MKKFAIIALAVFTLTGFAQDKQEENRKSLNERFTKRVTQSPEDRAKIESKQMTLRLDLSKDQQMQVEKALVNHYSEAQNKGELDKKTIKNMSDEKRQDMKINRLDSAIALKEKMKSILNENQYAKYSQMLEDKGKRMRQMRKQ